MKKAICMICALVLSITAFSGCAKKYSVSEFPEQDKVSYLPKIDYILAEFESIDLYAKMDIKDSYKKKTEKDDASSTSIDRYYDGDKLIYADYNGYGEDMFRQYLDSDKGEKSVAYVDEDGKRDSVTLKYEGKDGYGYSVSTEGKLAKKYRYGAQELRVYISDNNTPAGVYVGYTVDCKNKNVYVSSAIYKSDKGEYRRYADEGDGAVYDEVKYGVNSGETGIAGYKYLPAYINSASGSLGVSMTFGGGSCRFSYKAGEDGKETWYVTAPVTVTFESKEKRDRFNREYPDGEIGEYTVPVPDSDEDKTYFNWKSEATLELPADAEIAGCEKALELITKEFNDPHSYLMVCNEKGQLTELKEGSVLRDD